ncbi:hypothetical protein ABVT39_006469 [Epinephelus coioides]
MATKIKKYKRDTLDYVQGKVYKWVQVDEPKRPTTSHQSQSDTTMADSDFPSDSDSNRSMYQQAEITIQKTTSDVAENEEGEEETQIPAGTGPSSASRGESCDQPL